MDVDEGIKLEETRTEDFPNSSIVKVKKEYEECIGCKELQDKLEKSNDKCVYLEFEKLKNDEEAILLKQNNEEVENSIRSVKEELMIENKVVECEKDKAETEVRIWKAKCRQLEIEVMELKKRLSAGMMHSYSGLDTENKVNEKGVPPTTTPSKPYFDSEGFKGGLKYDLNSTVRRGLDFAAPHNSISPATPGDRPSFNAVDISDDDSGDDFSTKRRKVGRGVACVVSSESETDDDIPICRLKSEKRSSVNGSCFRENPRKRRLRKVGDDDEEDKCDLGEGSSKSPGNRNNLGISENLNNTLGEDEIEEDDDDASSEGESLGGFIVNSSETDSGSNCNDMSTHEDSSSGDCSDDSENESDSMVFKKVISGFRRERKDKLKWEYEADMLADFVECPELCMKAVCAVYRQQTAEEKSCKATIIRNGRGFNSIHALRGSGLAEFLTDGDPKGDVKKSVKELEAFNSKGVEQCTKLATHYSKQLFEIYQNKEDPFFHP